MRALFISDYEICVRLASRHLEFFKKEEDSETLLRRIPLFEVGRVSLVGRPRVSMRAVTQMMEAGIPVQVLSSTGRLIGSFTPARDGDAGIRIAQYRAAAGQWTISTAASIASAKLLNSRRVLQKLSSSYTTTVAPVEMETAQRQLKRLAYEALDATTLENLRGLEGAGASIYFRQFSAFFPVDMPFNRRSRRPPKDPVNSLLSWTYTMVLQEVRSALSANGLDPCIGILHALEYNRPSLALDLFEPLRAPLCDLFCLRLVKLGTFKSGDFETDEAGGIRMKSEKRKDYFTEYEKRINRAFKLQGEERETTFREVIRGQAACYAKAVRSRSEFKPFMMP